MKIISQIFLDPTKEDLLNWKRLSVPSSLFQENDHLDIFSGS